jgi:hypothetical protein
MKQQEMAELQVAQREADIKLQRDFNETINTLKQELYTANATVSHACPPFAL